MLTIALRPDDLDGFRAMLREQLAGDLEHLADLQRTTRPSRTPEVYGEEPTRARVALVERLGEAVGGLY